MVCDAFEIVAAECAAMIECARVWSTEAHRRVRLRLIGDWHGTHGDTTRPLGLHPGLSWIELFRMWGGAGCE